ncbi:MULTISPECIES: hypothetical protein [unclassified Xanthobacter]|uniref:hypothetical protein n=1 Tax=unclassified Xanthobacter TaxID=2623496 RepID=UPI001F3F3287|nr:MULTISPECIES: hypothetical protein [unclassified Xanthobacter]
MKEVITKCAEAPENQPSKSDKFKIESDCVYGKAGKYLIGTLGRHAKATQLGFPRHALERLVLALDPIAWLTIVRRHLADDPKLPCRSPKAGSEFDPAADLEFCAHCLF